MKTFILSSLVLGIGFTLAAAPNAADDKTIPPTTPQNPLVDVVNPAPPAPHDKQTPPSHLNPVAKRVNVPQKTPPATGKALKPVPEKVKVPKSHKAPTNK